MMSNRNMTGHLSSDRIALYLARSLPPAEILALHGHLEVCDDCRHAVGEAATARVPRGVVPLLHTASDDDGGPHLSEEEMVALVARTLPEDRRLEAARHVAGCEICRDSTEAMESVRDKTFAIPIRRTVTRRWSSSWYAAALAAAASLLVVALVRYWPSHPRGETPAVVASLLDGGQKIELDARGELRGMATASPAERDLVIDALRHGSLTAGADLPAEPPGVLLTPDAASAQPFSLTSPIQAKVLSDRPVFTWQAYQGATAYQVLVTNEALDPLVRSGRITATRWQTGTALPRGSTLLWQVRAWRGAEMVSAPAPPAPPARFEIVAERIADRLAELRNSPRPSHLLAAVICAREGLRDEAADEMQVLARENPDSPLVRSLQANPGAR